MLISLLQVGVCTAKHNGDRKSLAAQLGISERALYRKLAA
ncbi:MAG: helix-turn-helix domain-containing protein [Thiobacillus sp.]|nr:helix-turn-helix domain-containing protein [Thiobacillus sp.]